MRRITPTILVLCLLAVGCRDYDIIVGQTCYAPHNPPAMAGWGHNISRLFEEGAELQFQGIYTEHPYYEIRIGLVRQFDRSKGWSFLSLSNPLPVTEGTLVEVQGILERRERAFRRRGIVKTLRVQDFQVLYDTSSLREMAQREYREIREKLQQEISLPGSKLQLNEDPDWRVDWLRGEEAIAVAAHFYDLMYAADVQFLFTKKDQRLKAVYLLEWFKGE